MQAVFSRMAPAYDALWTETRIGNLQRHAFWRTVGPLFKTGDTVLDLGCGTGEDAVILGERGIRVLAIDYSPEMVRIARERGADARVLPIEDIGQIQGNFAGAISDFGAMNCVARLSDIREPLGRMIRPEGVLAICIMGRFCLWETLWYGIRGRWQKASRRWSGQSSFRGMRIFYPTLGEIRDAFSPEFELTGVHGIGVCVPPSFVNILSNRTLDRLGRIDAGIASWPFVRALADHRLLIFRRRSSQ